MSLPRASRLLLSIFAISSLAACGSSSYDTTKVKSYKLAVLSTNADIKTEFKKLIADFNTEAGMTVVNYVDSASDANSSIILTPGLREKTGGKVGLGQWLSETRSDNPMTSIGKDPKQEIDYSMRLEFDETYITDNMGHNDRQKIIENQKLFFHETGHGLEMNHNPNDIRDVMYPDVSGDKDFDPFFAKVRNYMADQ